MEENLTLFRRREVEKWWEAYPASYIPCTDVQQR